MKMTRVFLILLVGLLCWSVDTKAQNEYTVFQYTTRNGLPQNSVKSAIMDDNGFLWMTTEAGLVRFDGRNFKIFDHTNTTQIKTDRFNDIVKTPVKDLLAFDMRGTALRIRATGISAIPGEKRQHTEFYIEDAISGKGFFAEKNRNGLNFYSDSVLVDSINTKAFNVRGYFMLNGFIYFLTHADSIFRINFATRTILHCTLNNPYKLEAPEVIWSYGRPGAFIKCSSRLYSIVSVNGVDDLRINLEHSQLPLNCIINTLVYDSLNNTLFVGTDAKGLFVFKKKFFKTLLFEPSNENHNNIYYSQHELDDHFILADHKRELGLYNSRKSKLPFSINREAAIRDKKNNIWFNEKDILYRYNLTTQKKIKIQQSDETFASCFLEVNDTIWLGTNHAIAYVLNDTMHKVLLYRKAQNSSPFCMLNDGSAIWFSNFEGVYKLDKTVYHADTINDFKDQSVRNMIFHRGYMFLGTYGYGYYMMKGSKIVAMPLDAQHNLLESHSFIFDSKGNIWIPTNRGLNKTSMALLEKYFADQHTEVHYMWYAEEDGINNAEFNGGCTPPYIELKNGYFSLPSMEGMVLFKPDEVLDARTDLPIIIDAITVDNHLTDSTGLLSIPASAKALQVNFSTAYWGNAANLVLEYKVHGLNDKWISISNLNRIILSGLHAGNYTLLIRKRIGFDETSFSIKSISFKVEKKFYATAWFMVSVMAAAILLIIAIARLYVNNIRQRNRLLEEKVKRRTAELEKAHEKMKQSVNLKDKLISILSHDILTPLRFISLVARKGTDYRGKIDPDQMHQALDDIRNTADKLRDNTQNILSWIKYQNKRIIPAYSHISVHAVADEIIAVLNTMAENSGTKIVNLISYDDVIKTDKNLLSIVLHNVLSNAIKFTEQGTITVEGSHQDNEYKLRIIDTGEGITPEQLQHIQNIITHKAITATSPSNNENGNGLGYIIISELMELLQGKVDVESIPDNGTTVTLQFNYN